jgi:hypothetical protein
MRFLCFVAVALVASCSAPVSFEPLRPTTASFVQSTGSPSHPGVTYHSIMGDCGKDDTPNSSDGVVPHWSSHMDGAASEKIVPSGHSAHQNPEGIKEVGRILHLHLKSGR